VLKLPVPSSNVRPYFTFTNPTLQPLPNWVSALLLFLPAATVVAITGKAAESDLPGVVFQHQF